MTWDLSIYWSGAFVAANVIITLHLLGALLLGMLIGYERQFQGRAAGMRMYGLVCMASTALTVFVGYASFWYGGAAHDVTPDATRVVGGVMTGIGFLGAGVIVKEGLNISGLTTAASIWVVAAVGVLIGSGLYLAAILMAGLCVVSLASVHRLEARLPGRATLEVCLTFVPPGPPPFEELVQVAEERGYRVLQDSLHITFADSQPVWRFWVVALDRARAAKPAALAQEMAAADGVTNFSIVPVRT